MRMENADTKRAEEGAEVPVRPSPAPSPPPRPPPRPDGAEPPLPALPPPAAPKAARPTAADLQTYAAELMTAKAEAQNRAIENAAQSLPAFRDSSPEEIRQS